MHRLVGKTVCALDMFRRRWAALAITLSIAGLSVCTAFAQQISSADLIARAGEYDAKPVIFRGEVIGDAMARKDYAWINVYDGSNALGVWLGREQASAVTLTGSYKTVGDTVEVRGIFYRSCPEHGGDMDIHAQSLAVVKKGARVTQKIDTTKTKVAAILAAAAGLLWILSYLKNL